MKIAKKKHMFKRKMKQKSGTRVSGLGSGDQKNDNLEVALARLPGRYPFQE